MPNTREIRRRIRSVENTRQITRAMEMVAATKMRRAQTAVLASRDYADKARDLFTAVQAAGAEEKMPLLEERPVKKRAVIVVTSDRGLCGSMNTNVLRQLVGGESNTSYIPVGRKGQNALRNQGKNLLATFTGLLDTPHYTEIIPIARVAMDEFTAGNIDQVSLVYPKFVSTLQNEPTVEQLLPAKPAEAEEKAKTEVSALTEFEPSPEVVLTDLLPRLVEIQIWQALLETRAAFFSSQMVAMQNASKNASDLLDGLRFTYNQARQAAITTEIAEIASAAAA